MITRKELEEEYWQYYLLLEDKFINTLQYVELRKFNYWTFSNEYELLIQAIGAELDSVFKMFCGLTNSNIRYSIADYAKIILEEPASIYPDIVNQQVIVMNKNITLQPFKTWDVSKAAQSVPWWQGFVNIKHNRNKCEKEANLKNVLSILSALYLLEMKEYKRIFDRNKTNGLPEESDIPDMSSKLFLLKNWNSKYVSTFGAMIVTE